MMGIRIDPDLKKFFQEVADEENRNLSNFIINAVLTYIKEHKGLTWKKPKKKGKKQGCQKNTQNVPLYNHDNCRELHNKNVCAISVKIKIVLKSYIRV